MSRLRRLKEKTRKSIIKTTMASLALVLAIGSTQIMGTYALFKDTEDVTSNLSVSTGDVDIEIEKGSEGFNETGLQPNDSFEHEFVVKNHGTLKQNITLQLEGVPNELKPYIEYNIKFDNNTELSTMFEMQDGFKKAIVNNNRNLFILDPGKNINLTAQIIIDCNMPEEIQMALQNIKNKLILRVESTQINDKNTLFNNGFYDLEIQENYLTIGEYIKNIITGMIKVTGHTVTIEFKDVPELTKNLKNISVINNTGTGQFLGAYSGTTNSNKLTIDFPSSFNLNGVGKDFEMGHTVKIRFEYNDGTQLDYLFDFRKAKVPNNHSQLDAKYELILSTTKDLDKGVEVTSEPETVEPPKEEVEIPSGPEVVEPSKEEAVVPSKPDIIDLSKEEIETQE